MKHELDEEKSGCCFNCSLNYAGGEISLVKDYPNGAREVRLGCGESLLLMKALVVN